MSRIKATDTKPEILVRKYLHAKGFRFRLYNELLPGKPDLTLPKSHTVIFINGCFWHGHTDCRYFVLPKTRPEWWNKKIHATVERDIKSLNALKSKGWNTIVIWECQLKPETRDKTLENIVKRLTKSEK